MNWVYSIDAIAIQNNHEMETHEISVKGKSTNMSSHKNCDAAHQKGELVEGTCVSFHHHDNGQL